MRSRCQSNFLWVEVSCQVASARNDAVNRMEKIVKTSKRISAFARGLALLMMGAVALVLLTWVAPAGGY